MTWDTAWIYYQTIDLTLDILIILMVRYLFEGN